MQMKELLEEITQQIGFNPRSIQAFFNTLEYDYEKAELMEKCIRENKGTVPIRSVGGLLLERKAICMEAAYAAEWLLQDYSSRRLSFNFPNRPGHAVCVYENRLYGAVGFSRSPDLRDRPAIFVNEDALALSYYSDDFRFESYEFKKVEHSNPLWGVLEMSIDFG